MRQKNSYSRIIQNLEYWGTLSTGSKIKLFHHSVERGITTFYLDHVHVDPFSTNLGEALSESGLSRDEIQLIGSAGRNPQENLQKQVEKILSLFETDYLDLLIPDPGTAGLLPALEQLRHQGQIVETGVHLDHFRPDGDKAEIIPRWASLTTFEATPASFKLLGAETTGVQDLSEMLLVLPLYSSYSPEIEKMAEKYRLKPEDFLLSWILNHNRNFHTIVKADTESAIDAAYHSLHTRIIDQDWKKVPAIF